MTVADLIKRSLRLIGATNVGDTPTNEEFADALAALNALVDSWATERLTMYTSSRTVYAVTAGKQTYSLGPAAVSPDWTGARPMYLDAAGLILQDGSGAELPLHVVASDEEWARIRIKPLTSTVPTKIYLQADYPSATVALWPSPASNTQVALYTPTAVSQFTSYAQALSLPPGYQRALAYNLALELAPEFDKTPDAAVFAIAEESKASLKRANVPGAIGRLRVDAGLRRIDGRVGAFDWRIGE